VGAARAVGSSPYQARMGIHCHGNGAYWLEVTGEAPGGLLVTNLPEAGRQRIEKVQALLEPESVYPLLRGRDVGQWHAQPSLFVVMPHAPENASKAIPLDVLAAERPKTYAYLAHFREFLAGRSGYKQFFNPKTDPFYSLYNVGPYTFAPYKVVWRYIASEFTCAVVSNGTLPNGTAKVAIPETKLVLVPFDDELGAHFVCAMLSSAVTRFIVQSYAVSTQIATHVLNHVHVPPFDRGNSVHGELAALSIAAHEATARGDCGTVPSIEAAIDEQSASLWAISDAELADIHASLGDLRSKCIKPDEPEAAGEDDE